MDSLLVVGGYVQRNILFAAGLLKNPSVPGLVSLILIIALGLSLLILHIKIKRRRAAVAWLRALILKTGNREEFSRGIESTTASIKGGASNESRSALSVAWEKYRETLVPHDEDGATILRNSIRPSAFLNVDDLGFGAGAWRIGPGLFVTVGLFLTFLGLVSALNSMSGESGAVTSAAMSDLLKIASAKFIMSLTGLFCSIVFTVVFRTLYGRLESAVHALCNALEKNLSFISLESLAVEQLSATREQREHFRLVGMELVAELGRPLREELPAAISSSIQGAMAPLMEKMGKMGTDGVEGMVKNLSTQFADDVSSSLAQASKSLSDAGGQIKVLAERLDQSSGRMGAEMETSIARVAQAVDDLRSSMSAAATTTVGAFSRGAEQLLGVMNKTLEGIRDNTGEGSRAMSAAAGELRGAAEGFRQEIESAARSGTEAASTQMKLASDEASAAIGSAGSGVLQAFGRRSAEISQATDEFSKKASAELMAPLGAIADKLDTMVSSIAESSVEMRRMADGVRAGGDASAHAAVSFQNAAKDLTNAANPIRATTDQISLSLRSLESSTGHVAKVIAQAAEATAVSAENTARSADSVLSTAERVLADETVAMRALLGDISQTLARLQGQGAKLDIVDEKLGHAFDMFTDQVKTAVDSMSVHVRELTGKLQPALDTMREIVEQAEHFAPQSRSK